MQMHNMHHEDTKAAQAGMAHMGHMGNLKRTFFISLVLAVPVLLLSPMMGLKLPFQFTFPGSDWVVLVLSTVLFFYGGRPFLRGALDELKAKRPAMMTLISLGIVASYLYSLYAFAVNHFGHPAEHVMDFFWELATLIVIMLLGHWIEMRAVSGAGDALEKMAALLPSDANVRQADGSFHKVPLKDVAIGQTLMVQSGENIPADGVVREGASQVNEAMVTGEAREVSKTVGDTVIGGSKNGNGSLLIEVTGTGESGYLAQVMQLVSHAQTEKSAAETLSDRVARWLFYVALGAGTLALVIWLIVTGDVSTAITRMVSVLVIACPHALGLAIPLVVARSTSLGAQNGLLVRNRQALDAAPRIDVVTMDKTGTLTEGRFRVTAITPLDGHTSEGDLLSAMASLERGSAHPLAVGILQAAESKGLSPAAATDLQTLPGVGLEGTLPGGKKASIVNAAYLDREGISYDKQAYTALAQQGHSVSFLLIEGRLIGLVAQGDTIKPEAKHLVQGLKAQHITPVMLTGDNEEAAKKIAAILGIEDVRGGLMPQDKEAIINQYRQQGHTVMMVGDGINDAPSLARADVGVAIGAGTDVAMDAADVVLVKSDPGDILHFLSLAKSTSRKMKQNLWWGAGYNIVAIPLAAGVLAPLGILLSPAVGAVLMSLSTVIVAINALTLRIK